MKKVGNFAIATFLKPLGETIIYINIHKESMKHIKHQFVHRSPLRFVQEPEEIEEEGEEEVDLITGVLLE